VSNAYTAIFAHFESAKRLGLTATPDRTDGVALANVFDAVAYEMSMLSAIEAGWLVPLRFKTAETDFDATKLRTIAGEVDAGSVAKELVRSGALHQAANTMSELAGDNRAVAFLPTVAASKAFCVEINARHDRSPNVAQYAAHIDGTTPEQVRNEVFEAFKQGVTRVISNVGVLCEGWDAPHASVIALLNPTKSRSRVCQMIGRGTRLHEGKDSTLVIDFCPGRMKKGRLASPADALAGKMLPDNVHDQLADEGDLAEAIEAAQVKAEDIEERKRKAADRAKAKAEKLLREKDLVKKRSFVYGLQEHDMHSLLGGYGDPTVRLSQAGVDVPKVDAERRKHGMCSLKQANILKKNGLNPNLSWKMARIAIDEIATNNWKCPSHIATDARFT
jgi:superfamily II DNA or RNA helicase